ncbi:hypothetical protein ACFL58_00895 [Elusimicrobiota bacterium]
MKLKNFIILNTITFLIFFVQLLNAGIVTDRVGIGSISDPTDLEVLGRVTCSTFTMTTGVSAGYVLKCDAAGAAYWAAAVDCSILNATNTWTAPNSWTSSSIFNANMQDKDFRIKGQLDADLFFADASQNEVGIGTSAPHAEITLNGRLALAETTVPTASSGYGKLFCKATDSQLYYQDGTGDTVLVSGQFASIEDQKTSGTNGGTFTSGAWQTRTLNAVQASRGSFFSLSSNQVTLAAGTYRIMASAPAYYVGAHKLRLRNITDGTTAVYGTAALSNTSTQASSGRSVCQGIVTIAAQKTFEVQHYCASTRATDGLGQAAGFGDTEIYAILCIQKIR